MEQSEIERVARRFHEVYEQLYPQFAPRDERRDPIPWKDLPSHEARLLIATVSMVMQANDDNRAQAQHLEFDRNHWQRKVGVLLSLIDRYAEGSPLQKSARDAVNTNWYTQSMGDPIADIAQMTTEKTIETAVAAGIVTKPNGAG